MSFAQGLLVFLIVSVGIKAHIAFKKNFSGGEEMTLEEALKRIEFLEKALDGAIWLAKIEQTRYLGIPQDKLSTSHYYECCDFEDEPELAQYLIEEEKKK